MKSAFFVVALLFCVSDFSRRNGVCSGFSTRWTRQGVAPLIVRRRVPPAIARRLPSSARVADGPRNGGGGPTRLDIAAALESIKRAADMPNTGPYGRSSTMPGPQPGSAVVESPVCPDALVQACAAAAACYDQYCGTDGTIADVPQCPADVSPACDNCYPYSRCGDDSGHFIMGPESPSCYTVYQGCRPGAGCYAHSTGACDEVTGEFTAGAPAYCAGNYHATCQQCFPNSKCSNQYYKGPPDLPDCDVFDGIERCWKTYVPATLSDPPKLVMDVHGFTLDADVQVRTRYLLFTLSAEPEIL